ncbi:MAG: erythromycin esterase family protein [Actinomycetes bacterium]
MLQRYRGRPDVVVLALPRGGVPVAFEVATALAAPLDVFVVRKLGVPGREEVAMGALASGGVLVLNEDVIRGFRIRSDILRHTVEAEGRELLRREVVYRDARRPVDVRDRTVILVDDGLATGASMRAAIRALRQHKPAAIVVALPAAPKPTCEELAELVEEVVCATTPSPFLAVGASYADFDQTTDDEVRELLRATSSAAPAAAPARPISEAAIIRADAIPLEEGMPSSSALLDLVGDARFVLIGEASHGTHEFYAVRAHITQRLIQDLGFCAVAAEADWPDAYRVNRWVRGRSDDADAEEALRDFQRFPTWMWRNTVVLDFVGWLRDHNERGRGAQVPVGFYGLDLYSLHRSAHEVITYLEGVDPEAANRARERYSCFDHASADDGQAYGYAAAYGAGESCERGVVEQLVEMQRRAPELAQLLGEDELFYAQLNALTVHDAERYYRTMFGGRVSSWNLRDGHMANTLDALTEHLTRQNGTPAKIVVWEHNSHLGDARATESALRGELNVGQVVRERHPGDCRLIGFTTHSGTVTAADDWGASADRKRVRPALPGSVEQLFHDVGEASFLLHFTRAAAAADVLRSTRLERAIGVIYRPQTERQSHYFQVRAADQFDALIHIDETRALEPLERTSRWEAGEAPDTYPFAV